jgi:cytochrome P450
MWSWWTISYWVLGIILVVALIAAYVIYRGYLKVKPKPLEGIPAPPLSHAILGHPDKMLHPLRHDLRLGVCDSAGKSPVHQLVLMKHSSVFVDSSLEAGYVMQDAPEKGPMYNMFRFDQAIPDLYASDGDEWKIRSEGLSEALRNIELTSSSLERIKANLISKVEEAAENGTPLDLKELFTLLGFDVICEAAFGYQLDALSGSEQGSKLRASLKTLEDAQAGQGIYASPNARSVPPEEINTAKAEWRAFLDKLLALTQTEGETFTAKHGELQPKRSFRHALLALSAARGEDKYGANEMRGDIHQVLRHGHETLAGTLMWIFFALHRNPDVRLELEKSVQTTTDGGIPLYLDWTLMESMRRHPVVGNMTVRTPTESIKVAGQFEVPPGTPLHLHMYSLQNTQREWKNPRR